MPAWCNGIYFWGGADVTTISRTSNVVSATLSRYPLLTRTYTVGDKLDVNNVGDSSFNGTFTLTAAAGNNVQWSQTAADASSSGGQANYLGLEANVKNLGEMKNQDRALIEGNIFENNWDGQSDQDGQCFNLNAIGSPGDTQVAVVTNVTIRYNLFKHCNKAGLIGNEQNGLVGVGALGNFSIHDDVWDDMSNIWGLSGQGTNAMGFTESNSYSSVSMPSNITINHVTIIQTDAQLTSRSAEDASMENLTDSSNSLFIPTGTVSTSGLTVTLTCASPSPSSTTCTSFNNLSDSCSGSGWGTIATNGCVVIINGVKYQIDGSVARTTTSLTLLTSAGTQTGVTYTGRCKAAFNGTCPTGPPATPWPGHVVLNSISAAGTRGQGSSLATD